MEKRLETKQMKLTNQTLKRIIKEELASVLLEGGRTGTGTLYQSSFNPPTGGSYSSTMKSLKNRTLNKITASQINTLFSIFKKYGRTSEEFNAAISYEAMRMMLNDSSSRSLITFFEELQESSMGDIDQSGAHLKFLLMFESDGILDRLKTPDNPNKPEGRKDFVPFSKKYPNWKSRENANIFALVAYHHGWLNKSDRMNYFDNIQNASSEFIMSSSAEDLQGKDFEDRVQAILERDGGLLGINIKK
jgi:hypothetical protein